MKYLLLRYHRDDVPLYFVIEWEHEGQYATAKHVKFTLEEHSCPTNWIGQTKAIIDEGEGDPHGFLQFVKIIDAPVDEEDIDLQELFPEAYQKAGEEIADRQGAMIAALERAQRKNLSQIAALLQVCTDNGLRDKALEAIKSLAEE
jgi:hypothetical protein